MKKVYENVESYKTSTTKTRGNKLVVEGIITFKTGSKKKTSFVFEAHTASRDGKARFIGDNREITNGKKAFNLVGKIKGNKFLSESLNYNYKVDSGNGKRERVVGTINKKK